MTDKQIEYLAEAITEDIFIEGATRLELKKPFVGVEKNLGGWGKEPFKNRVRDCIKSIISISQLEQGE